MPRLVHPVTGVTIDVSDEKAARLGATFSPAPEPKAEPAKPARRSKAAEPESK